MRDAKRTSWQPWCWRHLRLDLPADWEMLAYGCDPAQGRCSWADRQTFRLELSWQGGAAAPDFGLMLSGYAAELARQSDGAARCERRGEAGWQGLETEAAGGHASRYGRYFAVEKLLVELVLLWPGAPEPATRGRVLSSTALAGEEGGRRLWEAFGMRLWAGGELSIAGCRSHPGYAELAFSAPDGRRSERYSRRGFVPSWLRGTVADWLRGEMPGQAGPEAIRQGSRRGHDWARLSTAERRSGLRGLIGGWLSHEGQAWICPRDGRLYSVRRAAPREREGGQNLPADAGLVCCPEWEEGR